MICRYCLNYRKGQKAQEGRVCAFTGKIVEKTQDIPYGKKGKPCEGFTLTEYFWCESNQHTKHFSACIYNFLNNDDCKGCLQNEEVVVALQVHQVNHKIPFNRRKPKLVMFNRRNKPVPFKRRTVRNES